MLHLQASVHFEEVRRLALRVVQKLHRAGAAVVHLAKQRLGVAMHPPAHPIRQIRRRTFLHHLLMPPLQRTIAVAKGRHRSRPIAERLHFDMARLRHATLQEQPRIAELGLGKAQHRGEPRRHLVRVVAALHADAATASGALQHHRIADALGLCHRVLGVLQQARSRQQRHARVQGQAARLVLQAELPQLRGTRPDEGDAALLERLREGRVLAEEAVAGVNRLGAGANNRSEQLLRIQVRFGNAPFAERHRLASRIDVHRVAIRVGVDSNARHAKGVQRTADARGHFATVGD